MSISERALMEADLADQIEGEFSTQTILIDPNGLPHPVAAQVLYDARRETEQNGVLMIIKELVITYRQTSVPPAFLKPFDKGNAWGVKVPLHANSTTLVEYLLEGSKGGELGSTIGTIRVYPKKIKQAVA